MKDKMKGKTKEENIFKNYIPEKDELEQESNHLIDIKESKNTKAGRVDFPEVEEEYTESSFKADIAQQAGRFSDQVLMGSPAAEARAAGKDEIADIIDASEEKLSKKLNKNKR